MVLSSKMRIVLSIGLVVALLVVLGAVLIKGKMQHDLWEVCSLATLAYPQTDEPVEALLVWIQDPTHTLPDRNRGIWAIGQLRDPRALPVLEEYYHGDPCSHESELCQRELKKAMALIKGEKGSLFRLKKP